MGASITLEKIFREEPYKSIINLLVEYREGLRLKHIQYAIFDNSCLQYFTIRAVKEDLGYKIKDLIDSGKVKKYQIKQINRTKKQNVHEDPGKCVRNNLNNFLKKMMVPPNKAIYKEKGKYKIYDSSIKQLIRDTDKECIDICSNRSKRNLLGGRINIYGYCSPNTKVSFLNFDKKKSKDRYNSAITKFQEAIDELQSLMDESIGYYLAYDVYYKILENNKYSPLDKQILQVLYYYGRQPVKKEEKSPLETWLKFDKDCLLIKPDIKLVNIFKKHFYPKKKTSEIKSILKGHMINKEISLALVQMAYFLIIREMSHIVAVIHSGRGHLIKQSQLYNDLSNIPMFTNDINKRSIELLNSYEKYSSEYFEKQDNDIQDIKSRALKEDPGSKIKIEKMMNLLNKEITDIDDWLDLQKNIWKLDFS